MEQTKKERLEAFKKRMEKFNKPFFLLENPSLLADDPLEKFKKRMEAYNKPEAVARRKEIEQNLKQIGIDFNLM